MKLYNNPEIKEFTVLYLLLTLVFGFISFLISPVLSVVLIIFAVSSLFLFFLYTKKRYRKISELSDAIDKILHGEDILKIEKLQEGELSVLETQLEKMFIRLKEHRDLLKKEKRFLADSIADISHQLRTPLTSINLILSLLSDENIEDSRRTELLRELSSQITATDKLVTTLLKISKLDAGTIEFKFQQIILDELIKGAAEPLLILMDIKNISLDIKTNGLIIIGDSLWLTEAFSNIIKNAVEHTPENGRICISASDNPIYTEITLRDNGAGFCNEDIPHIFERFYKGKNTSKDSFGIGLNLAKTVITSSNGTIKAENAPEGGAVFTVKLYKKAFCFTPHTH